jgi:hypothetical protein
MLKGARDVATLPIGHDEDQIVRVKEHGTVFFWHDKDNALDVGHSTSTQWFANVILDIAEELLTKPYLSRCLFDR